MSVQTIATIFASASGLLETLIAAQVAGDPDAESKVKKVFGLIDTVGGIAGHGLEADEALASRLVLIRDQLDGMNAAELELTEADFTGLGDDTLRLEAELQATIARRRALEA